MKGIECTYHDVFLINKVRSAIQSLSDSTNLFFYNWSNVTYIFQNRNALNHKKRKIVMLDPSKENIELYDTFIFFNYRYMLIGTKHNLEYKYGYKITDFVKQSCNFNMILEAILSCEVVSALIPSTDENFEKSLKWHLLFNGKYPDGEIKIYQSENHDPYILKYNFHLFSIEINNIKIQPEMLDAL